MGNGGAHARLTGALCFAVVPGLSLPATPAPPGITSVLRVVLLAALPAAEPSRILKAAPGVDLVLGGIVPKGSEALEAIEGVPCFLVQGKGQYLGEVVLAAPDGNLRPVSGRRVVLGPEIAADPEMEKRIRRWRSGSGPSHSR